MALIHLSLALLIAIFSLAASITFLTAFPDRQPDALRCFFVAWVAVSGAIFWLMASAILARLFRGRSRAKSESLEPALGECKYFKNGTRAPTIGHPIPRTLTCNTIKSSSLPSTISSMPSPPDSPSLKPAGSSRCNMLTSPELPPQLPSIFSPFQFHPPDDKSLYPQHLAPPRSDSLLALVRSTTSPLTPPKSTFDEILPVYTTSAQPHTPSPKNERASLASTVSNVSSSATLQRCASHTGLASPEETHVISKQSTIFETSGSVEPPRKHAEDIHRRLSARTGKSLPLLPKEDGTWYRCHLKEGGSGHRLSTSSI